MLFRKERVQVILDYIETLVLAQRQELSTLSYKPGLFLTPEAAEEETTPWEIFSCQNMHWYGPDRHYWFRGELKVPKEWANQELWLWVTTQIDEWDDSRNPQFLLFVDGEVRQGLDMYHREAKLSAGLNSGEELVFDLQAYSGTRHQEFALQIKFGVVDQDWKQLYYDIKTILLALNRMESSLKSNYEKILNQAINLLALDHPDQLVVKASLEDCRTFLQRELYQRFSGQSDYLTACIGHTHIDVAWWWTVEQTKEKVARSFSTVLRLMKEYDDYKFMSSQPQLYQFLKERYPELFCEIKARVSEGRWEPEGAMWVEADTNLPDGESLVRQFLWGKAFFQQEFQRDSQILWLPDVFGYSAALPQVMKLAGVKYFMTTKISWNQYNRMPNDSFYWKGIDGSEILTHFISTVELGVQKSDIFTTYNGMLHPEALMGAWERYSNKSLLPEILVAYGYGDGGGGPTREMLEISERMKVGLKGLPQVEQKFSADFFADLEQGMAVEKVSSLAVPYWEGELYLEYHRGTYTSNARIKKANRKTELLLGEAELLATKAWLKGMDYPKAIFEELWKLLLLHQFHDVITGVSIKEVYDKAYKDYDYIQQKVQEIKVRALDWLTLGEEPSVYRVFNGTSFRGSGLMPWPEDAVNQVFSGLESLTSQLYEGKNYVWLTDVPAKGFVALERQGNKALSTEKCPFQINETRQGYEVETPFYSVVLDQAGGLLRLWDKEACREILKGRGNDLRVYEDRPMHYDNWNIDEYYLEKSWGWDRVLEPLKITAQGDLFIELTATIAFRQNTLVQKCRFYQFDRTITFKTEVDWQTNRQLLRVLFPLDIHSSEAVFDIQFGNVSRKTHNNTSWEQAQFETCAHRWADISEQNYGVALLNDCKYGYSAKDATLGLSLIKSGTEPEASLDQGRHSFTYALYPHIGGWREAEVPKHAGLLNQPLNLIKTGKDLAEGSFLSCGQRNIIIDGIKVAEDQKGVIIRLHENENCRTHTELSLDFEPKAFYLCDLLENRLEEIPAKGNSIALTFKPYEIISLYLEVKE